MKILFLSQGRRIEDHPGWEWALAKLKTEGVVNDYHNIPWIGYGEQHGWSMLYKHVVDVAAYSRFDVIYFHYFHRYGVPSAIDCIEKLRSLQHSPIVVTSIGDAYADRRLPFLSRKFPECFRTIASRSDIVFSTQMGRTANIILEWGARNVVLSPNSLCPVRFKNCTVDPLIHKFDFDVVMVGSRNGGRWNPFSEYSIRSRERNKIVRMLSDHFGKKFAVFGNGWEGCVSNQGPVSFDSQQRVLQMGRICVGGNPYSYDDYYSSNRVFFEIASGIPTIELRVPRLDKMFRAGYHCHFIDAVDDVVAKCEELLHCNPVELYRTAASAAKDISERHTQYHRMKFMVDVIRRYCDTRNLEGVGLPFFLPETDFCKERQFAIRSR